MATPELQRSALKKMKIDKNYLWAFACLNCRKSFKRTYSEDSKKCPHCGENAINLGRHFKPPKRSDDEQWEKVQFLIDNGFAFHKIYDDNGEHIPYPKTLSEAKEFVITYKNKSWKK